jgi:hypothetical protein
MLGWESKKGPDGLSKKKAAQSSLNELKMAIRKKSLQLDKK